MFIKKGVINLVNFNNMLTSTAQNLLSYFKRSYDSRGDVALLKGIPMSDEKLVRSVFKDLGQSVKLRYRGPRRLAGRTDKHNAQSYCLKRHATTFAVYYRNELV